MHDFRKIIAILGAAWSVAVGTIVIVVAEKIGGWGGVAALALGFANYACGFVCFGESLRPRYQAAWNKKTDAKSLTVGSGIEAPRPQGSEPDPGHG